MLTEDFPIAILNLPPRVHTALKRACICTVRQLTSLTVRDLLHVRRFGHSSLAAVTKSLDEMGLRLMDDHDDR